MAESYLQFGCGLCAPTTWRNFDASPSVWLAITLRYLKPLLFRSGVTQFPENVEYGDIVAGLPVAPGSVSGIYCSHVLEHLALSEFRQALRNVYGYLEPGGVFRMVVPDLAVCVQEYLASSEPQAASDFVRACYFGQESRGRGPLALIRAAFSRSAHLWMWDEKSLTAELEAAGFIDIRRASCGDNPDPRFRDVEDSSRWRRDLGLECRRPPMSVAPERTYAAQNAGSRGYQAAPALIDPAASASAKLR